MIKEFIAGFALLATISGCYLGDNMQFDELDYIVAELSQKPQVLNITGTGQAEYWSHTNWHQLENPEIGFYKTALLPDKFHSLVQILSATTLETLPDHWGKVLPGDRYQRIRLKRGPQVVEKLVGSKMPIDMQLQKVINQLDQIVDFVSQYPQHTLRIELNEAQLSDSGSLTFKMTLSNKGGLATYIYNPISLLNAENGWLSIQVWSDQVDASKIAPPQITHVENLQFQEKREVMEIAAGRFLEFRLRVPFTQPPGQYYCRVLYANFVESADDVPLITGEVVARPIRVNVP